MERVIHHLAHAKINVFLRVVGRRPDGYHDIRSLITPISLADDVTLRAGVELRLSVRGPHAERVPMDERNLSVRAAEILASACGVDSGAEIELEKRIPVAAGLGGGSADAAAVLLGLTELWGCGLDGDELSTLAAGVGSDVPALLRRRPVLISGRGEIVESVDIAPRHWVLLPQPFPVATADAYRWWDEDGGGSGPDPAPLLSAAAAEDPGSVAALLSNDLQRPVANRHPEIGHAERQLLDAGALAAIMCGSGPTVAGLARSDEDAERIAGAIPGSIAVSAP